MHTKPCRFNLIIFVPLPPIQHGCCFSSWIIKLFRRRRHERICLQTWWWVCLTCPTYLDIKVFPSIRHIMEGYQILRMSLPFICYVAKWQVSFQSIAFAWLISAEIFLNSLYMSHTTVISLLDVFLQVFAVQVGCRTIGVEGQNQGASCFYLQIRYGTTSNVIVMILTRLH